MRLRFYLIVLVTCMLPVALFSQSVHIGDILCTDGTIISAADFPTSGRTALGIVFYVDDNDLHGWAVALHNQSSSIKWSNSNYYGYDIPNLVNYENARSAMHNLDGSQNTDIIRNAGNSTNFPAAWAVDYDNGWFLPSAAQLRYMFSYYPEINASLQVVGGSQFLLEGNYYWWSSTECSGYHAYDMNAGGSIGDYVKDNHTNYPPNGIAVRQIIDFNIPNPEPATYHIGDLITNDDGSQGVLFYVSPDQTEGWMVALNDASTSISWGNGDVPGLNNQTCPTPFGMLLNEIDGYANTGIIRDHQSGMNTAANVVDYDESGVYEQHLFSIHGCDSIVTLHLSIADIVMNEWWQQTCNEPFTWNGTTYTATGDYDQTFISSSNCDSIVTLHLTIADIITNEWSHQTCEDKFIWNGITYSETGDYEQIFISSNNCDSIVTLHLNILDAYDIAIDSTVCGSLMWNGQEYTQSGHYEQQFVTAGGCDSLVRMDLTVLPFPEAVPEITGMTEVYVSTNIVVGQYSYSIDSVEFATHYEWILEGQDWIVDTTETLCTLWVTTPGTTTLKVRAWNSCGYTEQEIIIHAGFFDIDENQTLPVAVYPNPTKDKVFIEAENIMRVRLFDLLGQCLLEMEGKDSNLLEISTNNLPTGIYAIEILTKQGKVIRKLNVTR